MNRIILFNIIFLKIALCGIVTTSYSQNGNPSLSSNPAGNGAFGSMRIYDEVPHAKILTGNPYLDETWMKSKLWVKNNEKPIFVEKLRYNMVSNFFEVQFGTVTKGLIGADVNKFELIDINKNTRSFVKHSFEVNGSQVSDFFEVLYEGNIILLQRFYMYIKPATYNTALMIGEKNDQIIIKSEYYSLKKDDELKPIKRRKDLKNLVVNNETNYKVEIQRNELIKFFKANEL